MVEWVPAKNGEAIGQLGTEGGVIIRDEEWPGVGRITLERKRTEAAITCGLYGTSSIRRLRRHRKEIKNTMP